MTTSDRDEIALKAMFQAAKSDTPAATFLARLLEDAEHAATSSPTAQEKHANTRPRWFDGLLPASGLAIATLAGVWIGVAVPEDSFEMSTTELDIAAFLPGPTLNEFADWDDVQ